MTRNTLFRLPSGFAALAIATLVFAPHAALAQRGGHAGGGGGGHFGGFTGGGGHVAGHAGSHSASSSHSTAPHPAATTPPANPANAARSPAADSLPPGMVGAARALLAGTVSAGLHAQSGVPVAPTGKGNSEFDARLSHVTIGFPPVEGSPSTFANVRAHSGPLSFSGQGHEIWQNFPASTPSITSADRNRQSIGMRPVPPHKIHGQPPYYYPYTFFPAFGFYGFDPFLGFGWYPGCDPIDPWMFGCGAWGLGYGYSNSYGYGYGGYYPPALDYSAPSDSGDSSSEYGPFLWQNPPAESSPPTGDSTSQSNTAAPNSVIYLQDGTNFDVRDYWAAEGKLHYVTAYGGENSVDLGQVDIRRSVDASAARGLSFSLHPAQATPLTPPPSSDNAPPASTRQR